MTGSGCVDTRAGYLGGEGAQGDQVLRVEFPDGVNLDEFELVDEFKPYREWCVPAA